MTVTNKMAAIRLYRLSRITVKFKATHIAPGLLIKRGRGAAGILELEGKQTPFIQKGVYNQAC